MPKTTVARKGGSMQDRYMVGDALPCRVCVRASCQCPQKSHDASCFMHFMEYGYETLMISQQSTAFPVNFIPASYSHQTYREDSSENVAYSRANYPSTASINLQSPVLYIMFVPDQLLQLLPRLADGHVRCNSAASSVRPSRRFRRSEWDTCATQVIVEEAGGSVVRFEGEETRGLMGAGALQQPVTDSNGQERNIESKFKLGYNKENLANPSCLFLGKFRD